MLNGGRALCTVLVARTATLGRRGVDSVRPAACVTTISLRPRTESRSRGHTSGGVPSHFVEYRALVRAETRATIYSERDRSRSSPQTAPATGKTAAARRCPKNRLGIHPVKPVSANIPRVTSWPYQRPPSLRCRCVMTHLRNRDLTTRVSTQLTPWVHPE
jgi:hypothetical protein